MGSRVDLVITLDRPGISEGIDVNQLAPTLVAIAELIQCSNRLAYPASRELKVAVKPFAKGSFIIDLAIGGEIIEQIMDYVISDKEQIISVLAMLGLIYSEQANNLLDLIKFVGGKVFKVFKKEKDTYVYSTKDGSTMVNGTVHNLFQNPNIKMNVKNMYVNPLKGEGGIEKIETFLKEDKNRVRVGQSDLEAFEAYASSGEFEEEKIEETKNVEKVFLRPTKGSYKGEERAKAYYFQRDDGKPFPASVKDREFLKKLRTGAVRFHYTDTLKVELLELQTVTEKKVDMSYEILKVLEYHQDPRQKNLPGL